MCSQSKELRMIRVQQLARNLAQTYGIKIVRPKVVKITTEICEKPEGSVKYKYYTIDGKRLTHSITFYDKDGLIHRDDDLPAKVKFCNINGIKELVKKWYQHGKKHRVSYTPEEGELPASIKYHPGDVRVVRSMCWYYEGKKHRMLSPLRGECDDKPALIRYFPNSTSISLMAWYQHGKRHRNPCVSFRGRKYLHALIEYAIGDNGNKYISMQQWYQDDKLHRDGMPASITYIDPSLFNLSSSNVSIKNIRVPKTLEWFKHGLRFRVDDQPNYLGYTFFEDGTYHFEQKIYSLDGSIVKEHYLIEGTKPKGGFNANVINIPNF